MAVEGTKEKLASTVLWRIENISFWEPGLHGNRIESPEFQFYNMGGEMAFKLHLYPKEVNGNDQNLCLCISSEGGFDIPIESEWSLLGVSGLQIISERMYCREKNFFTKVKSNLSSYEDVFIIKKSSFLPNDILTVRLRIWKLEGDFAQADHITAFTRFKVVKNSLEWRVKGFSCLQLNQEVTTPLPINLPNKQVVLTLKMVLRGLSLDDSAFYFEILTDNRRAKTLTVKISVLDNERKAINCVNEKYTFGGDIPKQTWILPKFIYRKEILERKSEWLCDDDLTWLCEVHTVSQETDEGIESSYSGPEILQPDISKNIDIEEKKLIGPNPRCVVSTVSGGISRTSLQSTKETNTPQHSNDSVVALQEDFLSLYTDHSLSDFELRAGEVCFPVHKVVLCARSPVFRAMFCGDLKEANSSFQDIPDVDVHSLGRLLTFLYSGTVDDLQWESAAKLYYAADKYQVSTLKRECSSVLRSNVTVSNVSEILELADKHQDQELTSFVHEFFAHHYDEIVLSEEWDKFMKRNISLAGHAMKEVYKRKLQLKDNLV